MFGHFTIWEAIKLGGPIMYLLILCSMISLAVVCERLYYFHKRSRTAREIFIQLIRQEIKKSDVKKILTLCQAAAMPFATVICAGLSSFQLDEKEIAESMERQIVIEINNLEQRIAIVGTIGSTAVYIGLLGTVWGIIRTFEDIYKAGSSGINVIIHGISEALVCTAAGLLVAIPAVMAYNYFTKRIKGFVIDMELCASETSSLIKARKGQV